MSDLVMRISMKMAISLCQSARENGTFQASLIQQKGLEKNVETTNCNLNNWFLPIGSCDKLDYECKFFETKDKFECGSIDSVEALNYLVTYIDKNKEQLEKIIALLEEIRSLGFDEFGFK